MMRYYLIGHAHLILATSFTELASFCNYFFFIAYCSQIFLNFGMGVKIVNMNGGKCAIVMERDQLGEVQRQIQDGDSLQMKLL